MRPWTRHILKVAAALVALETVLFLYPPVVERLIPNYFIHMEVWIPLGIGLHVALAFLAYKRRPRGGWKASVDADV